ISGSTQGIGYAIARGLAREGVAVTLNGRTDERCAAAVARLRNEVPGAAIDALAADLADPEQVAALAARVAEVDILVNNAGVFDLVDFATATDAEWQRYLDVDLLSAVRLSRAALPGMLARGSGRIISIASESGV